MGKTNKTWISAAAVAALVITQYASGAAREGQQSKSNNRPQASGSATGTLTVGTSHLRLSHAYVFPEKGNDPAEENYRIFVMDRPLAASALKDEDERGTLLADGEIRGIEVIVAPDDRVLRAIVHHPELERLGMALGLAILETPSFQSTTRDGKSIAGQLRTPHPVQDARVGTPIQFEATFSAQVSREP